MSADLSTIGASRAIFDRPATDPEFEAMSLAIGDGERSAMVWDSANLCRFAELAADGQPTSVHPVGKGRCIWLTTRPGGYLAVRRHHHELDPLNFLVLDSAGSVVEKTKHIIPKQDADLAPARRIQLADGRVILSWLIDGAAINAETFASPGAAAGPPARLVTSGPDAIRFSMTPMTSGALLAFSRERQSGGVVAQTWDGIVVFGPEHAVGTDGMPLAGVDVAATGSGALVAWTSPSDSSSLLTVQPVTASGEKDGPPLTSVVPPSAGAVRIVRTPTGAMAIFEAREPGSKTAVYALNLVCSR